MNKLVLTTAIALLVGVISTADAKGLPQIKLTKPAVTADATGVKITKPAAKVECPANAKPCVADKIAAEKAKVDAKVAEAQAAKDAAVKKVADTKTALDTVKEGASTTPQVDVTKPAASLDENGLKITKPAVKIK